MVIRVDSPFRALIERYLLDEIPFLDFEERFVVATWDSEKLGDPDLTRLVDAVICLLVDFRDGRITDDEFHSSLWAAITTGIHGEMLSRITLSGSSATEPKDESQPSGTTTCNVGTPLVAALS
ncbi:MAG TPA: hypothetical protein PK593_03765 [Thermomicrobiales bacterium]|jgi:hypothetical protein|nr:hypothetical protein [Thermomicrobiales bacterium]